MEHGSSLAGKSSRLVSSVQPSQSKGTLYPGASGRRDPNVVIDVWSRLWPSTMVGKRSYRNTLELFRDLSNRMNLEVTPLITTDGFKFYERVIGRVFGPACVYGQVIKTRRNDRVVRWSEEP
jgi:hypothetical protein